MSLYAVKNDEGYYWDFLGSSGFWSSEIADPTTTIRKYQAEKVADETGGHVVELTETPAKVVVSKEEADMLELAKDDYCAASVISAYSTEHIGAMGQDRLMRAYVIGWTVAKPKRWSVKVPHVNVGWYFINNAGNLSATYQPADAGQFTLAEIEHYGLQDCEKVEVTE